MNDHAPKSGISVFGEIKTGDVLKNLNYPLKLYICNCRVKYLITDWLDLDSHHHILIADYFESFEGNEENCI